MFKTSLALLGLFICCALPCQAQTQVRIFDHVDRLMATIEQGPHAVITVDNGKFYRHPQKSEKIQYTNSKGETLIKVNRYVDGFKLKQDGDRALWKVKFKEYGLKIANNNEMKNAYKIKQSSGKYKLKQGDKTLAKIKLKGDAIQIFVDNRLLMRVVGGAEEYLAVLAIPDVGWEEKLLLYTELSN